MPDTYDLFISYRRSCAAPVEALAAALDKSAVRYFLDTRDIEPWADISSDIRVALADSKALLIWCSNDYLHSRPCQKELATAYLAQQREASATRKRILLLNPETGSGHIYPEHLRNLQFAEVADLPSDADFSRLAAQIKQRCDALCGVFGELGYFAEPRWHEAYGGNRNPIPRFEGRDRELWRIHDALHQADMSIISGYSGREAVITGIGGQGKSLLAQEYAFRFGPAYPGGVFWLNGTEAQAADNAQSLNENPPLKTQLVGLLQQLERQRQNPEALTVPQLLSLLGDLLEAGGAAFLWIVDNLAGDLNDAAFRQWLAPSTQGQLGRTLLTTRSRRYDAKVSALPLPPLAAEEAYRLLIRDCPPVDSGEQDAARRLIETLGRHALACWVAGSGVVNEARRSATPYAAFNQRLANPGKDVLEIVAGLGAELPNGHERSIAATLLHSLKLLDAPGQATVSVATLLADVAIPVSLLKDIFCCRDGLDEDSACNICDAAIDDILIHSLGETRDQGLWLHPLVCRVHRFSINETNRWEQLFSAVLSVFCQRASVCKNNGDWKLFYPYASHANALLIKIQNLSYVDKLRNNSMLLADCLVLMNVYCGDELFKQGDFIGALAYYQASYNVRKLFMTQDTDNT